MNRTHLKASVLGLTFCFAIIACGGAEERTAITNRKGSSNLLANSKLIDLEKVVNNCATSSNSTTTSTDKTASKKILSMSGLYESLTSSGASNTFAASYLSEVSLTDSKGAQINNEKLYQTYILNHGLNYNYAPLSEIAPDLLKVVSEDCQSVSLPLYTETQNINLLLELVGLDAQSFQLGGSSGFNSGLTEISSDSESSTSTSEIGKASSLNTSDTQNPTFIIDKEKSSENLLVLVQANGQAIVKIKVVNSETLQVVSEKPNQSEIVCDENTDFNLRTVTTIVWGSKLQELITIDNTLYTTLLSLTDKKELLMNGVQKNISGRRTEKQTTKSVSLPQGFYGQYSESLDTYALDSSADNVFSIQGNGCTANDTQVKDTSNQQQVDATTNSDDDSQTNLGEEADRNSQSDEGASNDIESDSQTDQAPDDNSQSAEDFPETSEI